MTTFTTSINNNITSWDSEIKLIYNDSYISVFSKPQGLATMGETPCLHRSDALLIPKDEIIDIKYKKSIPVHRLDKSTGGLILCGKSHETEVYLRELFQKKKIKKRYIALCLGKIEEIEGTITSNIGGSEAISEYKVVQITKSKSYGWISTVHLWPITGKTHQLRRHMKLIGHTILGDKRYWNTRDPVNKLLYELDHIPSHFHQCYLWAVEMIFPHPNRPEEILTVSIDEPLIYDELRRYEESQCFNESNSTLPLPPLPSLSTTTLSLSSTTNEESLDPNLTTKISSSIPNIITPPLPLPSSNSSSLSSDTLINNIETKTENDSNS